MLFLSSFTVRLRDGEGTSIFAAKKSRLRLLYPRMSVAKLLVEANDIEAPYETEHLKFGMWEE